jgi:hypothetical protein
VAAFRTVWHGGICGEAGPRRASFFNWKWTNDGLPPPDIRRLESCEDETVKPGKLVADLSRDREVHRDVIRKSREACSKIRASCWGMSTYR